MAKFETDVELPHTAAIQKPGSERYAVPHAVASAVQGKLPGDTTVEASWQDGATLCVTVEPGTTPGCAAPDAQVQAAHAALQDTVGPNAVVPPFHPAPLHPAPDGDAPDQAN